MALKLGYCAKVKIVIREHLAVDSMDYNGSWNPVKKGRNLRRKQKKVMKESFVVHADCSV